MQLTDYCPFGVSLVRDVFIETGTDEGRTLAAASLQPFKELHSIEFVESRFLLVLERFASERFTANRRVRLYCGSSPDVLDVMAKSGIMDGTKKTTFWLDAHYQGIDPGEIDSQYGQCPLLAELKAIFSVKWERLPYIIIDDASMFAGISGDTTFDGRRFDPAQWPTMEQIKLALPDGYNVRVHEVQTGNPRTGIIYALPENLQ